MMHLLLALAFAQDAPEPCAIWTKPHDPVHRICKQVGDSGWTFGTEGQHRLIGTLHPDFAVDDEGHTVGQGPALDHRLRLAVGVSHRSVKFQTEFDLFDGQIAGDVWDIAGTEDSRRRFSRTPSLYTLRRLSVTGIVRDKQGSRVPLAIIEGGIMPATWWGLGLLANGGDREPWFGRTDRGDRMLRLRTSFAPIQGGGERLPLFFTVGGDLVLEDDTADYNRGQTALHAIASVLWRGADARRVGLFFTYRGQRESGVAPRPTKVGVFDLWVELPYDLGTSGWQAKVSGEAIGIVGSSQRALSYASPERSSVSTGAAVTRLDFESPTKLASLRLELGWMAAGGDPDSGSLRDFSADQNFNVGMVLFDELMGATEAATYALLEDGELSGGPPPGAEAIVTEGSVRRAAWVHPAGIVRPTDWLDIRAGYLAAWSTGPIAQPFYTARNGGTPTNHLNQATQGRFIGHEIQWGLGLGGGDATKDWSFRPRLHLEGGVALPSDNLGGGTLVLARARAQVDW